MYMEASNPHQPGEKTILDSPYFHKSGPDCTFRFCDILNFSFEGSYPVRTRFISGFSI